MAYFLQQSPPPNVSITFPKSNYGPSFQTYEPIEDVSQLRHNTIQVECRK